MGVSIGDRLRSAGHERFVGRASELGLFRTAVRSPALDFHVLYIFGPGGVGKTKLLSEFAALCREDTVSPATIDARHVEATPDAFLAALRDALHLAPGADPLAVLAAEPRRQVLLIDTYEQLEPLDAWIRDAFLPHLPENALVVLAGRQPPAPAWNAESGWHAMMRPLSLRNLSPEESQTYLHKRAVPPDQHAPVLDFTHGHPLALSLVADVFEQRGGIRFEPEAAPDVIQALLDRFVREVPGPEQRAALEACALARVTTEGLLAELLDIPQAGPLFAWLRGLSFVESGRRGLFPHDLAREALLADLRWRDPDRYHHLHRRAGAYYSARLGDAHGQEQQRILFDYFFLHRDNAVVRFAFEWKEGAGVVTDALRESDHPALVSMAERHEGEASGRILAHWLDRQPQGALVFRETPGGEPIGFAFVLALHEAGPEDLEADPAARAASECLRLHAPLRPGEAATHFRFWMARDTYQAVSPVQSLIVVNIVRQCLSLPGLLAYTFFPCADPAFWEPVFAYAEMRRVPEADFETGGRRYGVFGNDWRVLSSAEWLALLAAKETAGGQAVTAPRSQPLVVLSEPEFADAVRRALRDFCRPDALHAANPLLRSRVVSVRLAAGAGDGERVAALRALVQEAAESLRSSPRAAKGYRAVYHTYLSPACTQEQASERLDLPFSTYRRHLNTGIAQITNALWQREIGAWDD